jgi:hypothetical protein
MPLKKYEKALHADTDAWRAFSTQINENSA